MGAWIEIPTYNLLTHLKNVAPFVGAWIEMDDPQGGDLVSVVAPFVGAWIEMANAGDMGMFEASRTLCGCVD